MPDRLLVDLDVDGQGAGSQAAVLSWPEGELPQEVSRAPLAWPLDGEALEDLRWYLEDYLRAPFGVWEDRGPAVAGKLAGWGDLVFGSVFGNGPARFAYERARDRGLEVVFRSAEPDLLALPWELMRDRVGPVALGAGGISRSLPVAGGAGTLEMPGGRLRVLMVISRPAGTADVGYQMVARPLLDRLDAVRGQVDLTVLRPPTFETLRQAVTQAADAGEPFHVVHFDGHGVMPGRAAGGRAVLGGRPAMMAGPGEGVLAFERPAGGSDDVTASKVAAVLAEGRVPVVVLNACQSGAIGKDLEASVATALLNAGCAAVVAMAYSVYAVAAAEFMAAFYESLFTGTSVGQAVTAGRRRLFGHDGRPSPKGMLPLADWLVPVHYLRRDVSFPQARVDRRAGLPPLDQLLDDQRAAGGGAGAGDLDVVGVFVGRDDLFYQLEAAARLQKVVVVQGPGGTGKTELVKAFGRWWRDTGGVDEPEWVFWHSFEPGVAAFSLDSVLTQIGLRLFGADFARSEAEERRALIARVLRERQMLLIWDNFETVRSMPSPDSAAGPLDGTGCAQFREFLVELAARGRSAVLVTSRTPEDWVGDIRRVTVGGLASYEAAEYAEALLAPYPAARPRRARRAFGELMQWLDGHPLSMRLVLPRLDTTGPEDLLAGLQGIVALPDGNGAAGTRTTSLAASVSYSYTHLAEQTRRLLPAVCLFHAVADAHVLEAFRLLPDVPERFREAQPQDWAAALEDATRVGLLTSVGPGMYRIHPALPGYLAAAWRHDNPASYDTARESVARALLSAYTLWCSWLHQLITSRDAGLAHMLIELEHATLGSMLGYALDHALWGQAQVICESLQSYWETRGLDDEAEAWADRIRLATEASDGTPPPLDTPAGALWLFVIGIQATHDLQRHHLDRAERTYRQILAKLQAQQASSEQQRFIAGTYHQLGWVAQERARWGDAEGWYRKALAIWEELDNQPDLATTYHQLGVLAELRKRLDEAEDWHRKSLAIYEDLEDQPHLAGTYQSLGMVAQERGRLDDAEGWYRKALAIDEDLGDRRQLASTYHQLGMVAQERGQQDDAEQWYLESLAIEEELGNRPGLATSYHQLGIIAQERGRLDDAEGWYRKALAIREELGDRPGLATSYYQLGRAARLRGQLDEAENWYRKSLAVDEELGDQRGQATTYGQLCLLAEERGEFGEALKWTVRCVALFTEFPHPLTGSAPDHLHRLTAQLGIGALEQCWQHVTRSTLPPDIRSYVQSSSR